MTRMPTATWWILKGWVKLLQPRNSASTRVGVLLLSLSGQLKGGWRLNFDQGRGLSPTPRPAAGGAVCAHLDSREESSQEPPPVHRGLGREGSLVCSARGLGQQRARYFGEVGMVLATFLGLAPSRPILLPVPDSLTLESGLLMTSADSPLLSR